VASLVYMAEWILRVGEHLAVYCSRLSRSVTDSTGRVLTRRFV
jgi:hypothetical protein